VLPKEISPLPIPKGRLVWRKIDHMHPNDTVFLEEKDAVFQRGKDLIVWVVKGKLPRHEIDRICKDGLYGYEDRSMNDI
jgi:hypothetical protein